MRSYPVLLAILAIFTSFSSGKTTCLDTQPRSAAAASKALISQALHHLVSDKVNGPCSGKIPPHTNGRASNVGHWTNGTLTIQVHLAVPNSPLGQTCIKALNSIIHNCVEHGSTWGGNATSTDVKYSIYNQGFPKNWTPVPAGSSEGTSQASAAAPVGGPKRKSQATSPSPRPKKPTPKSPQNNPRPTAGHAGVSHQSTKLNTTLHKPTSHRKSPRPTAGHAVVSHPSRKSNTTRLAPTSPRKSPRPTAGHASANHHSRKSNTTSATSTSYIDDSYLSAGPPTALSPAQLRASSELAQISREGQARKSHYGSLYSKTHVPTVSLTTDPAAAPTIVNCDDGTWDLSVANYNRFKTDANLKSFWFGGRDTDGVTYPALSGKNQFLTKELARIFLPTGSDLDCTLEAQSCEPPAQCTNYGVRLKSSTTRSTPSHWAWFATHSIANIYSFGASYKDALTNAGVDLSLASLDLTKTFTKPSTNQQILARDLISGFAFLMIAAFVFLPVAGAVVAGGAAAISVQVIGAIGVSTGVGLTQVPGFIGNAVAKGGANLITKAADFGAFMETVFNASGVAIDSFMAQTMEGIDINGPASGTPTLNNMLEGGGWVNSNVVTNPAVSISKLQTMLYKNLLQRGINYIWTKSKIWVTFVDLKDDASQTKCKADKNGWQASKTCADGGVYYLYRLNEDGNLAGHLSYAWGAEKLGQAPFDLAASWVTTSSAKSYRAQNNGVGGFNYDYTTVPKDMPSLFEEAKSGSLEQFNGLEGTWNISVCDMGTNADWNQDFTIDDEDSDANPPVPCCCGPKCSQTADFVRSANMNNFDTLVSWCKGQLSSCEKWPPEVTSIDYGDSGTINIPDNCILH
ncbi:MAG: hypothetical protein M4579_001613 [Chaenotheca gracillima]|nr:MAG: hypothetical protein M4579_001613 [Chaenotheca gracillima]